MTEIYSRLKKSSYARVFLISLISFLIFYIPNYFISNNEPLIYISYFIREFIDSFIPVFSAAVIYFADCDKKLFKRFLSALKLSLPRLIYVIPYYYLYYMSQGFDSLESLMYLSVHSVFLMLVFPVELSLYVIIASFLGKRRARKTGYKLNFEEERGIFDLATPFAFSLFSISLSRFTYDTVMEMRDAISYLVNYAGSYRTSEIIFMLIKFLFVLATLLAMHALLQFMRKRAVKRYRAEIEEEKEAEEN